MITPWTAWLASGLTLLLATHEPYLQSVRVRPTVTAKDPEPEPTKCWTHMHSFFASIPPEFQPLSALTFSQKQQQEAEAPSSVACTGHLWREGRLLEDCTVCLGGSACHGETV